MLQNFTAQNCATLQQQECESLNRTLSLLIPLLNSELFFRIHKFDTIAQPEISLDERNASVEF